MNDVGSRSYWIHLAVAFMVIALSCVIFVRYTARNKANTPHPKSTC